MDDYIKGLYGFASDERIFQISKTSLHNELKRGAKLAGVKKIRVHDLRHSHVSLLIQLGYSALAIAERVGHAYFEMREKYLDLMADNERLKEENRGLKHKLEQAYEFMKQFVINGKNMLEAFLEKTGQAIERVLGR